MMCTVFVVRRYVLMTGLPMKFLMVLMCSVMCKS